MGIKAAAGERYTIRRQVFRVFGAGFEIFDAGGDLVGYCNQKAFKLREDLRVYTDQNKTTELLRIGTQQIIDFSPKFTVSLPDGSVIGTIQREGMKSMLRDSWVVHNRAGVMVGRVREDSAFRAFIRRFVENASAFMPQRFHLETNDGRQIARFRQHFNWFIYRLGISVQDGHPDVDDLLVLAIGCLLAAIEGRQG